MPGQKKGRVGFTGNSELYFIFLPEQGKVDANFFCPFRFWEFFPVLQIQQFIQNSGLYFALFSGFVVGYIRKSNHGILRYPIGNTLIYNVRFQFLFDLKTLMREKASEYSCLREGVINFPSEFAQPYEGV